MAEATHRAGVDAKKMAKYAIPTVKIVIDMALDYA
jgi:hypothetical protein